MRIAVVGTKGGCGKSILAATLAFTLEFPVVDADVDAPNQIDYIQPERLEVIGFVEKNVARAKENASGCFCPFSAIAPDPFTGNFKVDPRFCKNCGLCYEFCNGYVEEKVKYAKLYYGEGKPALFGAELFPGFCGSGEVVDKLLSEVERRAKNYVIDTSAGLGCKVMSAIKFATHAIILTEPTSLFLLEKVEEVVRRFVGDRYLTVGNFWDKEKREGVDFVIEKDPKTYREIALGKKLPWEIPSLTKTVEEIVDSL